MTLQQQQQQPTEWRNGKREVWYSLTVLHYVFRVTFNYYSRTLSTRYINRQG